jgi:N-acetylglutamate synthase-like GNAT family acetyltransferase
MSDTVTVWAATEGAVDDIVAALRANRGDPSLFQRSPTDIRKSLSDFLVARDSDGRVLGCAALHSSAIDLAEVLSVAVQPYTQGRGIGGLLVEGVLARAGQAGIGRVWLATLKPGYFARFGFRPISRWDLPAAVLLRKLTQVFRQAPRHWGPALVGRQTFMLRLPVPD